MAGEVDSVGKGFFTETGELKSKAQIAKEKAPKETNASEDKVELSSESTEAKFSSAINSVRGKFREAVNSVANVVNEDDANLKQAAKAVKEQIEAAKQLKTALKKGSDEDVAVAQKKFEAATTKRNELAAEINKDNDRLVTQRAKALSVGNEQVGVIKTKAVKFESKEIETPKSAEQVEAALKELKADRQSITDQRKELNQTKRELQQATKATEVKLTNVEEGTIRSLREAESTASDLASRITNNAAQALSASKISESVAQQLLQ